MRTTISILNVLLLAAFASADDFTLRNADGETFGPYPVREGVSVRLDNATYRIASVTNTAEQRLVRKMQSIVIPAMSFSNTPLSEVVDSLRVAAKKHDPAGEGLNIIFTSSSLGFANNVPARNGTNIASSVTFIAHRITLFEALQIAAYVSNFRCTLRPDALLLLPQDAPDGPLVTQSYDILPPFVQRLQEIGAQADPAGHVRVSQIDGRDMQATLGGLGVAWPNGSSVRHLPQQGKLIVVNTRDNLAFLERVLSVLHVRPFQVRLKFFFVAFPTDTVTGAQGEPHFTSDDALRLWKAGKGRVAANLEVMTRSDVEAVSKSVKELTYQTDFRLTPSGCNSNPAPATAGNVATPKGVATREIGFMVNAKPAVTPDGQMIDITLALQVVETPLWEEYPATSVSSGVPATRTTCRQPIFSTHSTSTQLSVYRNTTVVVGGGWPLCRTPEVMYLIMRTDLVGMDGKTLPPPDLKDFLPDSP